MSERSEGVGDGTRCGCRNWAPGERRECTVMLREAAMGGQIGLARDASSRVCCRNVDNQRAMLPIGRSVNEGGNTGLRSRQEPCGVQACRIVCGSQMRLTSSVLLSSPIGHPVRLPSAAGRAQSMRGGPGSTVQSNPRSTQECAHDTATVDTPPLDHAVPDLSWTPCMITTQDCPDLLAPPYLRCLVSVCRDHGAGRFDSRASKAV